MSALLLKAVINSSDNNCDLCGKTRPTICGDCSAIDNSFGSNYTWKFKNFYTLYKTVDSSYTYYVYVYEESISGCIESEVTKRDVFCIQA